MTYWFPRLSFERGATISDGVGPDAEGPMIELTFGPFIFQLWLAKRDAE